jgi:hypothetical protein
MFGRHPGLTRTGFLHRIGRNCTDQHNSKGAITEEVIMQLLLPVDAYWAGSVLPALPRGTQTGVCGLGVHHCGCSGEWAWGR